MPRAALRHRVGACAVTFAITAVAPIFGLIALGFATAHFKWFSAGAGAGLAEFAFVLAMPALLFRTVATANFGETQPLVLLASFFATVGVVWALASFASIVVLARPMAESAVFAMTASYGNIVLLGIPIALSVYGNDAAPTSAVIASMQVTVLWLAACLHLAVVSGTGRSGLHDLARSVGWEFARNPIVMAIIVGGIWRLTGIGLHPSIDRGLAMLAQAGVPTALIAVGFSIAGFRIGGEIRALALSLALKNIAMPVAAWLITTKVFGVPPLPASVIILFAAMPTGTATYLFASRSGIAIETTSTSVGLSTGLSMLTIPVVLLLLGAA